MSPIAELGPIAWPLAMTVALAGTGIAGVRSSRRRRAVDRALHELRRPLQVIALEAPRSADPALATPADLALIALDDLDTAISGAAPRARRAQSPRGRWSQARSSAGAVPRPAPARPSA